MQLANQEAQRLNHEYIGTEHILLGLVKEGSGVAANVLKWAVAGMEKRIRTLASEGVRNIEQFNNIVRAERPSGNGNGEEVRPLHYIVVVIDELADLMMVSANEVEESITRLSQKARAVGIHLICATQRPSVDILTGIIKANFPCRIAYKVRSKFDSRTILDSIGAEHLLGRGDMLYLPPGFAHGFCTLSEIADVSYWQTGYYEPDLERSIVWNDAEIGIRWPLHQPTLSPRDAEAPALREADINLVYRAG